MGRNVQLLLLETLAATLALGGLMYSVYCGLSATHDYQMVLFAVIGAANFMTLWKLAGLHRREVNKGSKSNG